MNTRQNPTIRRITLAALFSAIGIVLSLSLAYLDFGTGSFWLFVSLTTVYSYMEKPRYGFLPAFTIFLISLLYMSIWNSLVYLLPPLLCGVGYGYILKRNYKRIVGLAYLFTSAIIVEILGALMTNYVYHFNIFNDFVRLADNIVGWLKVKDDVIIDIFHKLMIASVPSYFMLSSLLNMGLTEMTTSIFLTRLKLRDRPEYSSKMTRKKIVPMIYYLSIVLMITLVSFVEQADIILMVFLSLSVGLFVNLTLFLGTQALGYIAKVSRRKKANYLYVIGSIAFIILMPFMAIYGSILILKEGKNEVVNDSLDGF